MAYIVWNVSRSEASSMKHCSREVITSRTLHDNHIDDLLQKLCDDATGCISSMLILLVLCALQAALISSCMMVSNGLSIQAARDEWVNDWRLALKRHMHMIVSLCMTSREDIAEAAWQLNQTSCRRGIAGE